MNKSNGSLSLPEMAARGVEALSIIVKERDELLQQVERMRITEALLTQKNSQLESRLETAVTERDHYMRYCTEITARLVNIQTLICTSIEAAEHAAFRPPLVPSIRKVPTVSEIDAKSIEKLIQRLPQNGGDN